MGIIESITKFIEASPTNELREKNLRSLLKQLGISFYAQIGPEITNFVCKGAGKLWFSAHWDTVHPPYSALDNTSAVFSLIYLKKDYPDANIVLFDKEEPPYMGRGVSYFASSVSKDIYMVNLDVIGKGNTFLLKKFDNEFTAEIAKEFNLDTERMPFTDADIFYRDDFPNIAMLAGAYKRADNVYDTAHWGYCHTSKDKPTVLEEEQFDLIREIQIRLMKQYN